MVMDHSDSEKGNPMPPQRVTERVCAADKIISKFPPFRFTVSRAGLRAGSASSLTYCDTVKQTDRDSMTHFLSSKYKYTGRPEDKMNYSLKSVTQTNGFSPNVNVADPRCFKGVWKMAKIDQKESESEPVQPPPVKYRQITVDLDQVIHEDADLTVKQAKVPKQLGRNMRAVELKEELERDRKKTEHQIEMEKKANKMINELLMKNMSESQIQQELSKTDLPPKVINKVVGLAFIH